MIGGERDEVSEQTNIVPFPLTVRGVPPLADPAFDRAPTKYEFTEGELAALCRWFSAMKYAFPACHGGIGHRRQSRPRMRALGLGTAAAAGAAR